MTPAQSNHADLRMAWVRHVKFHSRTLPHLGLADRVQFLGSLFRVQYDAYYEPLPLRNPRPLSPEGSLR